MNVNVRIEFELAYFEVPVQDVCPYTTGTTPFLSLLVHDSEICEKSRGTNFP